MQLTKGSGPAKNANPLGMRSLPRSDILFPNMALCRNFTTGMTGKGLHNVFENLEICYRRPILVEKLYLVKKVDVDTKFFPLDQMPIVFWSAAPDHGFFHEPAVLLIKICRSARYSNEKRRFPAPLLRPQSRNFTAALWEVSYQFFCDPRALFN